MTDKSKMFAQNQIKFSPHIFTNYIAGHRSHVITVKVKLDKTVLTSVPTYPYDPALKSHFCSLAALFSYFNE